MTRVGWVSDIHLNFLDEPALEGFLEQLRSLDVDGWLVGGDIGDARSVVSFLRRIEAEVPGAVYFVLGNHDFYHGSIESVRTQVAALTEQTVRVTWLTASGPVLIADSTALVGDDSWADARFGGARRTPVQISDFDLIGDLAGRSRADRTRTLERLGDEAAARLAPKLTEAADSRERVVVLTHVPPFREAAWHQGQVSSDAWLPWFACKATGDAILDCATQRPDREFLVLCGHTHGSGMCAPAPNVTVLTAAATYGAPQVQRTLEFE